MSEPRGVEERIDWHLSNDPSGSGRCSEHTWHALGGDYGNPPAWGCPDANACVDKVLGSGRAWTPQSWEGPPPRGAWVGWKYGSYGHAALSLGDGTIATTDPSQGKGMTGIEALDYPKKWGYSTAGGDYTVWTDQYAGVRFDVLMPIDHGEVRLSELVYGTRDSDAVRRLQLHLNAHPLEGGESLPMSGNYLDETDEEVRLCQSQHGFGSDVAGASNVGPAQAEHLIRGCACTVVDDREPVEPPTEPPAEGGDVVHGLGLHKWYSQKRDSKILVHPDGDWHVIDLPAMPPSGIVEESSEIKMLYLRIELPKGRSATRTIETHWERSDGDETAYKGPAWSADAKDSIPYENVHLEDGSGLGGRWKIKVTGGTDPIAYTTRYAKTHVIYQEAAA